MNTEPADQVFRPLGQHLSDLQVFPKEYLNLFQESEAKASSHPKGSDSISSRTYCPFLCG